MTQTQLMSDMLVRMEGMLQQTLADFSDKEMLVRPADGANSVIWQLGHLVTSTAGFFGSAIPGFKAPALPGNFSDAFSKAGQAKNELSDFPSKAEVLKHFTAVREALVAAVNKLTSADLDKPAPDMMKDFAPTVGHAIEMTGGHWMMHLGQIQVARRKLGKPILF